MKFFKEYIITAIVGLLLAVVLIVSAKDEGNTLTNAKQRSYDDNWTVQIGKQEKSSAASDVYKRQPIHFQEKIMRQNSY